MGIPGGIMPGRGGTPIVGMPGGIMPGRGGMPIGGMPIGMEARLPVTGALAITIRNELHFTGTLASHESPDHARDQQVPEERRSEERRACLFQRRGSHQGRRQPSASGATSEGTTRNAHPVEEVPQFEGR